jgi:bifunctional non-homologous end joining protein LigD
VSAAAKLGCRSAIIDGEVFVPDEHGASDFDTLRLAIKWHLHTLIFYAFDLLHLNGKTADNVFYVDRGADITVLVCNPG